MIEEFSAIITCGSLLLVAMLLKYQSYSNTYVLKLQFGFLLLLSWCNGVMLLSIIFQDNGFTGGIELFCLGIPVLAIIAIKTEHFTIPLATLVDALAHKSTRKEDFISCIRYLMYIIKTKGNLLILY